MSESRYTEDSRVVATASVTGPNKAGTVLRLLEQALAEERTEAKRLVRELWAWTDLPFVGDEKPYLELKARVEEFLRRG